MQRSQEKLCLQWNDYRDNISSAFGDLRDDIEFTDVALACEDGQLVEAHKVVLISSSSFFLNLLKRNTHPHPLIYMRGLKYENLLSMADFLYHGEANVYQEDIDSFLALAEELQLKGLDNREEKVEDSNRQISTSNTTNSIIATSKDATKSKEFTNSFDMIPSVETAISLIDNSATTDLAQLDQKVKSLMRSSENRIDKEQRRARICKVCGKEGTMTNIMRHITANHMTNISIPCNACGKTLHTSNALNMHKRSCQGLSSINISSRLWC